MKPLGDLKPKRIIATGQSQSAFRLVTYINAVQPIADVYDGFLVHSRFGNGAALSQAPLTAIAVPSGTVIRNDVNVPVTDLPHRDRRRSARCRGGPAARHQARPDVGGRRPVACRRGQRPPRASPTWATANGEARCSTCRNPSRGPLNCATPVNAGPTYAVLMAAMAHLDTWVRTGTPPPTAPRLELTEGPPRTVLGEPTPTYVITRDEYGNARRGSAHTVRRCAACRDHR